MLNSLVNSVSRFFPNIAPYSNDASYCLQPSCKKFETFNYRFWRKCQNKGWHLIPPDPQIMIFQNSGRVTFFTLLTPNFMQSFRKKQKAVFEIFKDGVTDVPTDKQGPLLWTLSGKIRVQNNYHRKAELHVLFLYYFLCVSVDQWCYPYKPVFERLNWRVLGFERMQGSQDV